jgi:UDPglucose 6-dehydrogenase
MHAHRIAILGLWHLGETYSACLAEIGHTVTGIDVDPLLIENLNNSVPPLEEPGLRELLERNREAGRLSYTTDMSVVASHDVVWIAFDTPVDDHDDVDLSIVLSALDRAIPYLQGGVTIAASSQLPAGTSRQIADRIRSARPDLTFHYFYSPENLRLGDAVSGFMGPGRIVIGADTPAALQVAGELFEPLNAKMATMSAASAEMAKHAMNAWLATSISFTNDIADVCEQVGADVEEVIRALKSEPRVGEKAFLFAGLGFSGGTLGRDLRALSHAAEKHGLSIPVIESAYRKNLSRDSIVVTRLRKEWGSLDRKVIALLGVTYKAGTSTLRRSQPLAIEASLRSVGALTRLSDPLAIPEEVAALSPSLFFREPYSAVEGADIALVMTPTRDYRNLDFARLARSMKTPLLFDTCNILVPAEEKIRSSGLRYLRIGV